MSFSYSLKNVRGLKETPELEIRPLTLLVGRNSAGKSTFLRTFPLLRQSITTRSSAPVLWFGDYVDFGDYKSAVSNNDVDRDIEFSFILKDYSHSPYMRSYRPLSRRRFQSERTIERVKVTYAVGGEEEQTSRRFISVDTPHNMANLKIETLPNSQDVSRILVNDIDVLEDLTDCSGWISNNSLFAECHIQVTKDDDRLFSDPASLFAGQIEKKLRSRVTNMSVENIRKEAIRILDQGGLDIADLKELKKQAKATFQRLYDRFLAGEDQSLHQSIDRFAKVYDLLRIVETLSYDFASYFDSVQYIGPARARSERFYRRQELEALDISPDGQNLPIFLASLNDSQFEDFSNWVEDTFGYGLELKSLPGNISILLKYEGRSVNIVDTGYGVSQILPVLAQIWWMQERRRSRRFVRPVSNLDIETLVIEQPELHLHPAHQAKLADVFLKSLKSGKGSNLLFLVETHSEALINRVGELISTGLIDHNDVQVIVFGSGDEDPGVTIQTSNFDERGVLRNWPFGFFNYS